MSLSLSNIFERITTETNTWQVSNIIQQDFRVIAIIAVSCSWSTWLMQEVKRKQERARRLLAWLSLAGNARRWWLPAIATAYANSRTFAPMAEQTSNFVCGESPVHRTRLSLLWLSRARSRAWFYYLWNVMHCNVYTYIQTLLRAMVTLQNDHLLPQSYYR